LCPMFHHEAIHGKEAACEVCLDAGFDPAQQRLALSRRTRCRHSGRLPPFDALAEELIVSGGVRAIRRLMQVPRREIHPETQSNGSGRPGNLTHHIIRVPPAMANAASNASSPDWARGKGRHDACTPAPRPTRSRLGSPLPTAGGPVAAD
jgi:hypothetical protein